MGLSCCSLPSVICRISLVTHQQQPKTPYRRCRVISNCQCNNSYRKFQLAGYKSPIFQARFTRRLDLQNGICPISQLSLSPGPNCYFTPSLPTDFNSQRIASLSPLQYPSPPSFSHPWPLISPLVIYLSILHHLCWSRGSHPASSAQSPWLCHPNRTK